MTAIVFSGVDNWQVGRRVIDFSMNENSTENSDISRLPRSLIESVQFPEIIIYD